MKPIELNKNLSKYCIELTKKLGLHFAGIDLIEHEGKWVILEINTNPGFSYFERESGVPISAALKDYLLKGIDDGRSYPYYPDD